MPEHWVDIIKALAFCGGFLLIYALVFNAAWDLVASIFRAANNLDHDEDPEVVCQSCRMIRGNLINGECGQCRH